MIFTTIQKKMLQDFKEKEFIYLNDFWEYYSTQFSIDTAVKRFIMIGILEDVGFKFKVNVDNIPK